MNILRRLPVVCAIAFFSAPAYADDDFIGLYRGIYDDAGSLDTISIVPNASGGYRIYLYATSFLRCDGPDKSATAAGDGQVRDDILERTNSVAICNGDGSSVNMRDGQFRLSHGDDLLSLAVEGRSVVFYHRISD